MAPRVRFAPSPTGNVHIGNIRVAIFNWLYARHEGGQFLLRIEDTDLERSTPEAIENLLKAMEWIGLDYDEEPVYQSKQCDQHIIAAQRMIDAGHASCAGDGEPTLLHLHAGLFDDSFVTAPRDTAEIDVSKGTLKLSPRALIHETVSSKGETFTRPILWDALADLTLELADGSTRPGTELQENANAGETDASAVLGQAVSKLIFKRRYVYYDDLILGRLEKPMDSLRDLVIVRSDGSPVFHLANVVDDVAMGVTHILRGNDHVENTYRHLFLYKAIGATPPAFGHLPMIVNAKGKPYSKRDGDAYVGDFRDKGFLPECLFNFLALCGWSPGDNREILSKAEMIDAFALERINDSAAQFNLEKLEWMNGQYLSGKTPAELLPLVRDELKAAGIDAGTIDADWLARLIELEQERMRTVKEFVANTAFFFACHVERQEKAVKKVLLKKEGAGLAMLDKLLPVLEGAEEWSEPALERMLTAFAESGEHKMGDIAQPLRVAVTGGTVSPGIWETLALVGRDKALARIRETLEQIQPGA